MNEQALVAGIGDPGRKARSIMNSTSPACSGELSKLRRLEATRSAPRTIPFENFLFGKGELSDAFGEALAERAPTQITPS